VKRGSLGASQGIVSGYDGTSASRSVLYFSSTDQLAYDNGGSAAVLLASTAVYRDPSAWYHILLSIDTTQATASNRVLLFVNGTQLTAFASANYPALNANTQLLLNNANNFIGQLAASTWFFDGYMTEVNFIDGQALTPSSFGTTDPETGAWEPMQYTGTYGTNGFYLDFRDNTSTTTLGLDYSGNSNNWTTNNISVTAGITYDSMLDVPTPWVGYSATTDTSAVTRGNYAVLNPLDKTASLSVINANLTASFNSTNQVCFSTFGVSNGKWYWEVNPSTTTEDMIGVANASATRSGYTGSDANGWSYYKTNGNKYNNATGTAYGATYANTDIIGVALDMDAGTLTFYKNNVSQGTAFTGLTGTLFPTLSTAGTGAAQSINFGQRPFTYTPPTGFKALCTTNLPNPTIRLGAQYFATSLYTGNGSTQSIVNNSNTTATTFQPDFVWTKSRSYVNSHRLFDAVRGTQAVLYSNLTAAETTETGTLTAFNSNGFSLGSNGECNTNAATYAAWQWRAGVSAVSNTSGTITSTVDAGTTQGFSIVTYAGTGANATVGHGLGVAPKMIIVKSRNASNNWPVWHGVITGSQFLLLNTTDAVGTAANVWNSTVPTSSVFSVGTNIGTNNSGTTYVAYCFAEIAGYSAFGSYTGNGSANGPFVYLGFRPRFVMIKRTDNTGFWTMLDSSRLGYNVTDKPLYANVSNAEATAQGTDFIASGFKVRATDNDVNTSSGTYIYVAFAENPFKFSNAR
jgi:hypothetical protein